jgi:hypothetical protein
MMARPIELLNKKLIGLKLPSGKAPQLCFCFAPTDVVVYSREEEAFWDQVCKTDGLKMLDLTDGYVALEKSFYPVSQTDGNRHPGPYGNYLLARLLDFYLPDQGWIPNKAQDK